METVFDVIQSLQLSFSQVVVTGLLIFIFGYLIGSLRMKRMAREKHDLEKTVMALNEELLYGIPSAFQEKEPESNTPVIGLKTKNYKTPQIAQ